MARRRDTFSDIAQQAVTDFVARHKFSVSASTGGFTGGLIGGLALNLTPLGCVMLGFLLTPVVYASRRGAVHLWWTRQFRRLLAADSLPYPGKKAAKAWRKREHERFNLLRKQFPVACDAHGVMNRAKITPVPRNVRSLSNGDITVLVHPAALGVKDGVKKLRENAQDIGIICGAKDMVVKPKGDGSAALTFVWTERMAQMLPIQMMKDAPENRIAYGEDEEGNVLWIWMMSVLIVGMTGTGKSSILWALIVGLAKKHLPFWLYVIDNKGGQELGMFEPLVGRTVGSYTVKDWAGDVETAGRVIDAVEAELKRRQVELRGNRKWNETMAGEYPLIVMPVDEALELMVKMDRVTRDKLLTIASQGRAAGVMVVMLSQAANKEILGMMRTIIPQRLALTTESPIDTGMIFGRPDAESEGARCSEIRLPGVGYARIEGVRGYQIFKSYYVEDDDIERITGGELPEGMGIGKAQVSELYAVYRYRTTDKQILYVGITNNFARRDKEHRVAFEKGQPKHYWYKFVDPTQTYITAADSKEQAKEVESREIAAWQPPGNTAENADNPRQGMDPVEPVQRVSRFSRTRPTPTVREPSIEGEVQPVVVPITRNRRAPAAEQRVLEATGSEHWHGAE